MAKKITRRFHEEERLAAKEIVESELDALYPSGEINASKSEKEIIAAAKEAVRRGIKGMQEFVGSEETPTAPEKPAKKPTPKKIVYPPPTATEKVVEDLIKPLYGRYDEIMTHDLESVVDAQIRAQDRYNKIPALDKEMMKQSSNGPDNFILEELGVKYPYFESKELKSKILNALYINLGVK